MRIEYFTDIQEEFIRRAHDAIWCAAATVNLQDRTRSRVLHPIWAGQTGWVGTFRESHKAKHLAHNPYMSLAYLKDPFAPVYVDCRAEWVDALEEKQYALDLITQTPPPLGYDIGEMKATDVAFGVLKLIPWRIELATYGSESKIWHAE